MGLYRPTVIRKRPDGTRRREKSSLWWGKYYDHARGKYVAVPLKMSDKSAAKIVFNRIQRDAATEADRPYAKHAKRPLTEHVEEWFATLSAKRTRGHSEASRTYVLTVFGGCGFKKWADILASGVETFIGDLVNEGRGGKKRRKATHARLSARTRNEYLRACKQFGRWMVADRRAAENPLAHLKRENVKVDRRRERRALTDDELRQLLTVTAGSSVRWGMTGRERSLIYRLAVETGLRANEFRTRRWHHFDLEGDPATVTIEAAYAKAGDDDTLPLRPTTAAALAAWRDEPGEPDPQALVFAMPHVANLAVMLRFDLAAARQAWIHTKGLAAAERKRRERSDFLEYRNRAGAVADFHSLRHTFGTNLARAGVHPKLAQDLMRHADINMTMNLYTHTLLVDRSQAVAELPDVAISDEAATDAA